MQTNRLVRDLGGFCLTDYRCTDIIRAVMYMTIQQILREKNLSRYQLSKKSGVPWATLADICSGVSAGSAQPIWVGKKHPI